MVTVEQFKRGVSRYLDAEVMPHITGWQKWVAGAASAAYLDKADKIIEELSHNEMIKPLELIDERNNIDVDTIYNYLRPQAEHCNASIKLPMVGTITFSVTDVDRLYQEIRR